MKRLITLFVIFGVVVWSVASASRFLSYETSENFGYTPPTSEELKDPLYGDGNEDLKHVAPGLWQ